MKSRVAFVKGNDRRDNIRRAIELIRDDIESKVKGKEAIIKPNCLTSSVPLSCTNVDALRGIMDSLSGLSPESVTLAESCRDSEHHKSFKELGYTSLIQEYGVSLLNLEDEDSWANLSLLNKDYEEVKAKISKTMVESQCRISAAVAKPAFNTPANSIKPHKHWVLLFDVTNFRLKRLVFCPKRDDIST